jgi:hypothetical protein
MRATKHIENITWIKRLEPFCDESLAGFLGRWARENVLYSRSNLLGALGLPRAVRVFPSDIRDLSKVLGVDDSTLVSIAPSSNPALPVLRRGHTRPSTEAVCPECLTHTSYSRQLWSHALATACPEHGVRLIDRCQQCSGGIHHDRHLPHLCDCGADLRKQR